MTEQEKAVAKKQEIEALHKKHSLVSDALYIAGALLVVAGVALSGPDGIEHGFIAAGVFCLVLPGLELLSGFIRGLRS